MSDCPRVLTKEQMIEGLKAGRALCVDRKDAPELPELLEMERQGLVTSQLREGDQYSRLEFRWKPDNRLVYTREPETCDQCLGSGFSNHPDSGEVCQNCKGKGQL